MRCQQGNDDVGSRVCDVSEDLIPWAVEVVANYSKPTSLKIYLVAVGERCVAATARQHASGTPGVEYEPCAPEQPVAHIDRGGGLLRDTLHRVITPCTE